MPRRMQTTVILVQTDFDSDPARVMMINYLHV